MLLQEKARVTVGWPDNDEFRQYVLECLQRDRDAVEAPDQVKRLSKEVRRGMSSWITNRRKWIRNINQEASMKLVERMLDRYATVSTGWPTHAAVLDYLFVKIWDLGMDEDEETLVNIDSYKEAKASYNACTPTVKSSIMSFITQEKKSVLQMLGHTDMTDADHSGIRIDLMACLELKNEIRSNLQRIP